VSLSGGSKNSKNGKGTGEDTWQKGGGGTGETGNGKRIIATRYKSRAFAKKTADAMTVGETGALETTGRTNVGSKQ